MTSWRASHRVPELRIEMARFALAGVLGLLADVVLLYVTLALGLGLFTGRTISFICAVWVTWQLNRRYTFTTHGSVWRAWWRYLGSMMIGGVINFAAYSAVIFWFRDLPLLPMIAVLAGSLAGMGINFVSAKFFVFGR